jgi:hypothetical protein
MADVGRPRIWTDPEELAKACDSYFEQESKPTVTGLALFLTFADKTSLYEYRDRPEFSYPIKRALTLIENYHEKGLTDNNVTGRIFALKNMGWKDTQRQEITGADGAAFPVVNIQVVKPDLESSE